MGKRKSKRKPVKRIRQTLDTQFDCLFCNHSKVVEVKMDTANKVGHLHCKICDVSYQAPINGLSEAVDVYSDWLDAVETVNKDRRQSNARPEEEDGEDGEREVRREARDVDAEADGSDLDDLPPVHSTATIRDDSEDDL